jgi:hypothetical protein
MAGLSFNLYGSTEHTLKLKPGDPGFSLLGRGLKGFSPHWTQNDLHNFIDVKQHRFQIVEAWNTTYNRQLTKSNLHRVITPFRAVNNAGDVLSRKYYSCGGSCQTPQHIPNVYGLKNRIGNIQSICDNTIVPAASCNVKYVYNSSDYNTYLKQKSIAKNFNDTTYGGDQSNGSQVALKAIRRY